MEDTMVNAPYGARNHRTRWTIAEMDYVEDHYRTRTPEEIAAHLGRTATAIKQMAGKLQCSEDTSRHWSEAEKEILHRHYSSPTPMQTIFSLLPERSPTAVMAMAGKLGLSRPDNDWTEAELRCLYEHYPKEGQAVLRRLPAKSDEAIREKARALGIVSPGHPRAREWDEKEWQTLSQHLHLRPVDLLPLFPDRSLSSIKNALTRLKRARGQGRLPAVRAGNKQVTTTWSEAEKDILTRWYETSKSMDDILAMLPGRPRSSVFSLAGKMGLSRPLSDWSDAELQILRDFYPTEGSAVARRLPGRQRRTAGQKAIQLGLRMAVSTPRQSWSEEEKAQLDANKHLSFPELQQMFPDRSASSLKNALNRIKKRQRDRS
ncbi:hypothetical protein ACI2I2_19835 [Scandinavium sp. NPDC088450]|uniref:hypothetical protein n=1 Tax=Scandinavium sp. NPDC088450 TaxID=3364514 RepID=UPI00384F19A1